MINKTNNTQFFIIKMIPEDPYIPFKLILNKTKDEIMEASQMMPLVIITEPSTNIITFEYVTRVILSEIEGMGILNFYFSNSEGSTSFLLDQDYPYTMISNNDISQ